MINLGTSLSLWLKYFCRNLGRTKTERKKKKKRCNFTSKSIQSHQSNHQLKSRGSFRWKEEKESLWTGGKNLSLSKPRWWHGFHEKKEVCCQNNCWGWSLPLAKGSVLRTVGWCWEWAPCGLGFRQKGTQVPAGPRARASSLPGQRCRLARGGLLELAPARTSFTLSFAFWAAWVKMVTQRICVTSPACGLAVWISQEPLKDRKIKEWVTGEEVARDARRESTEMVETEDEVRECLRRWERRTERWGDRGQGVRKGWGRQPTTRRRQGGRMKGQVRKRDGTARTRRGRAKGRNEREGAEARAIGAGALPWLGVLKGWQWDPRQLTGAWVPLRKDGRTRQSQPKSAGLGGEACKETVHRSRGRRAGNKCPCN